MPQSGLIFRALVASPSDCMDERSLIPEVISGWNAVHSLSSAAVIEPVLWETHSRPAMGSRPQELINKQLVENCDLVIGAFWTRLGTPTGEAVSGTAEEIEHFRSAGKPVLLYFSAAQVVPDRLDSTQYKALTEYRAKLVQQGLYFNYGSLAELRELLQRHLAAHMIELLAAEGGSANSASAQVEDGSGQRQALQRFLSNYQSFLRRTDAEWSAERDSEPYNTDDAKFILSRVADEAVQFKSMIENDSLGISEKFSECLRRLKALQRHQLYLDGGKSFTEFWAEGDAILAELSSVAGVLSTALAQKPE